MRILLFVSTIGRRFIKYQWFRRNNRAGSFAGSWGLIFSKRRRGGAIMMIMMMMMKKYNPQSQYYSFGISRL